MCTKQRAECALLSDSGMLAQHVGPPGLAEVPVKVVWLRDERRLASAATTGTNPGLDLHIELPCPLAVCSKQRAKCALLAASKMPAQRVESARPSRPDGLTL